MKPQINALTATRAFAAIMVFIHHFGGGIFPFSRFPAIFHNGNLAVSYFFVLSGFVLYVSYNDVELRYRNYLKRRIGRIVPVYLFALALSVYVAVHFHNYVLSSAASLKQVVFSALLMQAFIPSYPLVLNGPGWTISVEMFFYVLFPFLLLMQKRYLKAFIVMTVLLYVGSQALHLWYYPIRWSGCDLIVDTIFFNPVIHINQFMIGMIGGYLFNKIKNTAPKYRVLPVALFVIILLLVIYKPERLSYLAGLIAPLFMLFIVTVAINNPRFLNLLPIVFVGEISYGIYILQQPVYRLLDVINTQHIHLPKVYFFYSSLGILILFATTTYYLLELPLRRKIGALGARKAI